ncbi:hypothetical protein [Sphingomonas bacterium]|uniref:hypothetical protein n=1 Tax=Sphingomonas bacterium TaxID=1895847 RepID=UPI001575489E|nr:hypothetical protein [Sphingomonas bacterium]
MIAAALLLAAAPAPFTCGAVTRPGIAEQGEDGVWRGRAVEVCRAVAGQVQPAAAVAFHGYDTLADLRRAAEDRIAFLSAAELATLPVRGLRAGSVVAVERQVLVVPAASAATKAADLAARMICFIVGTRAEDALDAWSAGTATPVERLAFQEPVEMQDAFDVGKCAAQAVDLTEVPNGTRVLAAPLAATPILAATSTAAGEDWARTVATAVEQAAAHPK